VSEPGSQYDVVSPLGYRPQASSALSPGLGSLDGRKIAFVWNYLFRGDEAFALARQRLAGQHQNVEFVDFELFGNLDDNDELIDELPARFRELEVDGAFIATGG
jgi:hypothetical protein